MEDQIKECISVLRTSNNNQNIQNATKWIAEIIRQPCSINALFNVYTSSEDTYDRQHAIIYITKSIKFCWSYIDLNTQHAIFDMLTDILIREQVWLLRNSIIYAIYIVVSKSEIYESLLNFISNASENGGEEYLLIALLLAPVIKDVNEPIANFLISLLDRGFFLSNEMTQLQLDIKISSLHLLLFLSSKLKKYPYFNERFPVFWISSIGILDFCRKDYNLLKRVANYFTFALYHRMNLDPLLLLQKLMLFFSPGENYDVNTLLLVFIVIQNICHFYPDAILNYGAFPQIVDITISLSSFLYHPEDSLSLSYSNFFEPVYSDLCKSGEILQVMWNVITTISNSDYGRFYACCSLHATLRNFPSFFDDKLSLISQLLCISLSEGKRLLCEAAARAAVIFIDQYEKELDMSNEIIKVILEACKSDTSIHLLLYLTELLNITKDSEELFDSAFPFLMAILTSGPLELRAASLSALSSLVRGSTVKINVHFMTLFTLLFELLQSPNEAFEPLKPPAIETIAHASSAVTVDSFNESIFSFLLFCTANLNNSDLTFSVSCFNGIDIIFQSKSRDFLNAITPSVSMLSEVASNDFSAACKSSIVDSIDRNILSSVSNANDDQCDTSHAHFFDANFDFDDDFDFDLQSTPQMVIPSVSLRILSYMAKDNVELCSILAQHIVQCCMMQSKSSSNACKIASAAAIGNLAEGIAMARNPSLNSCLGTMSFILFSFIDEVRCQLQDDEDMMSHLQEEADLLSTCFASASKMVEWHDYESLGLHLKPILDFSLLYLSRITSEPSYDSNASKVVENINHFLSMISTSAEDQAPSLLSEFLSFYIQKLTGHPEYRFRSLAAHFFADIMYSSSEVLDNQFKMNALTFSANIADQDGDHYAFLCLRAVAAKEEEIELAQKIANNVYQICMKKISLPYIKSKRFLLMRDNAVSTLAIYALNIFKDEFSFDECLPSVLNALPLALDFTENENVMNFFVWAFSKDQNKKYSELFLRVLILLFANPPSVFDNFQINKLVQFSLLNLLIQLLSNQQDANDFIFQVLDGDVERANLLQFYLNSTAQKNIEERNNE